MNPRGLHVAFRGDGWYARYADGAYFRSRCPIGACWGAIRNILVGRKRKPAGIHKNSLIPLGKDDFIRQDARDDVAAHYWRRLYREE